MDIWEKIGKTASKTYQYTTSKTTNFAKEMKLKSIIQEDKNKIREEYAAIGKKVYGTYRTWALQQGTDIAEKLQEQSAGDIPELQDNSCMVDIGKEFKDECTKIDALSTDAREVEQELLELKHLKQCEQCHAHIEADSHYCSNCGHKQD